MVNWGKYLLLGVLGVSIVVVSLLVVWHGSPGYVVKPSSIISRLIIRCTSSLSGAHL